MSAAKLTTGNNGIGLDASALRKGMKTANFDAPNGLINQPVDSEKILQLERYGYSVVKGTIGEYYVTKDGVYRYIPDLESLLAYSGEPGGTK